MDKARPWQRNKFYKTRLCPYHFKKGSVCKEGDFCSYAHSFADLRTSVDLTKTKLCNDFAMGTCQRLAELCPFAHGQNDLRDPVIPGTRALDMPPTPPQAASTISYLVDHASSVRVSDDDEELVGQEAINQALELLRWMTIKEQTTILPTGGAFDSQDISTTDDGAEYSSSLSGTTSSASPPLARQ